MLPTLSVFDIIRHHLAVVRFHVRALRSLVGPAVRERVDVVLGLLDDIERLMSVRPPSS